MKRVAHRTSFEYRDDRSKNLLEVFNRVFKATYDARVDDVLAQVVEQPSRRFWVSEERALRVVRSMPHKGLPASMNALKREMYEEIYRRVAKLLTENPHWSLKHCVYEVLRQEAPKFYLSASSAHAIIIEEKKRCRIETMRRLSHFLSA